MQMSDTAKNLMLLKVSRLRRQRRTIEFKINSAKEVLNGSLRRINVVKAKNESLFKGQDEEYFEWNWNSE